MYLQYAKSVKGADLKFVEQQILDCRDGVQDVNYIQQEDILFVALGFREREIYINNYCDKYRCLMELATIENADINSIAKAVVSSELSDEIKATYANKLLKNPKCDYRIFKAIINDYYNKPCYVARKTATEIRELDKAIKILDNERLQKKLEAKNKAQIEDPRYIQQMIKRCQQRVKEYKQVEQMKNSTLITYSR